MVIRRQVVEQREGTEALRRLDPLKSNPMFVLLGFGSPCADQVRETKFALKCGAPETAKPAACDVCYRSALAVRGGGGEAWRQPAPPHGVRRWCVVTDRAGSR
jgi:hypothetical protein